MHSSFSNRSRSASRRTRLFRAFALGLPFALVLGALSAFAAYPNPAHDFAPLPVPPGNPSYNVTNAANPRPLLVVIVTFSDVTTPVSLTEANTKARVFGPAFPNLAEYYSKNSFGKMTFTPAKEGCNTADDGVVTVNVGLSTTWLALNSDDGSQTRADLNAVNALGCVNFAVFDENSDGQLTDDEISFQEVTALARGCGATRNSTPADLSYNGKTIHPSKQFSKADSNTNIITLAHEVAHQALGARDLYGFGVGSFDLFGPTCGGADTKMFEFSAWQKLHLGWITPTVVDHDAYYDVRRADTTGDAFILYDPDHGTDDYFIVENREQTAATYDQNASDSGLVIWRADDSQYNSGDQTVRPIDIMRQDGATNAGCDGAGNCYGGSNGDAWDPSDCSTAQRTMTRTWRAGAASNVAARAIGDAGDTIRVYFDVRGPGVLVDTCALVKAGPQTLTADLEGTISFPVMNTGEASDTFDFTITVPSGWSASTDTQTLGAGVGGTANVKVKPPIDAASTTPYTLTAVGKSKATPSITSSSTFQVKVVKRPTTLVYTGDLTEDYHDSADLSATLTDTLSGTALGSKLVSFALGTQTTSATTDSNGIASTSIVVTQASGPVAMGSSFAGDGSYLPSSDLDTFTITQEETTLTYTGPTVILQGASGVTLKARLLEDGTTAPFPSGQTVTLGLGGQTCTGTTDATGTVTCSLTFTGSLGSQPLTASFAGDIYYLPSSDNSKTAIVFAFPTNGAFLLGDNTVVSATPATKVTWWADVWPGVNSLSGGTAPSSFKGFANVVTGLPTSSPPASCSGTWTTTGGNSPPPTSGIPSYMGVIVTPRAVKKGNTISGNFVQIVVVKVDPGYAPTPDKPGTGTIVATFCPSS